MLASYPSAWLLLTLPFLSSIVVRSVPWLLALATRMNRLTRPLGALGLACLFAGLFGLLPAPGALPVALIGGAVSGYVVFSLPRRDWDGGGGGWEGPDPPPPDEPPPLGASGPIDWGMFDRLRAEWEWQPVGRR